ncbi:MAG: hypothetical protein IAB08_00615 [Bacteroidetes bacterium]|uniref:Uncharacterized protein n=1 Tax=Candidatus Pullibacteroides excrementavium TaxID=2840905 RepID=A0A9D9DTG1_9BACT|nr:hypothetical protein [Candidatus Pullibacteroides excrementavium]
MAVITSFIVQLLVLAYAMFPLPWLMPISFIMLFSLVLFLVSRNRKSL